MSAEALESRADTDLPLVLLAYKQEQGLEAETKVNRDMIERAIGSLNVLCPNLKFVVFPSGTRVSFLLRASLLSGSLQY